MKVKVYVVVVDKEYRDVYGSEIDAYKKALSLSRELVGQKVEVVEDEIEITKPYESPKLSLLRVDDLGIIEDETFGQVNI